MLQCTRDPVVIEAASDLGQLTSDLSSKIWQQINIVQTGAQGAAPPLAAPTNDPQLVDPKSLQPTKV